jgi:drug/metabolite transporter, DME family
MDRPVPMKTNGEWLILAAAVLWGTTGTALAFAPAGTPLAGVGAVRLAIGGLALLAVAAGRGRLRSQAPWPVGITLLAGACLAGYQLCFLPAVTITGVAVGTVVSIGSAPVLTGALGWLLNREIPDRHWGIATMLAILGCALLVLPGGELTIQLSGIGLALGSGLCYALYALLAKRLLKEHAPEAVMAVVFCLGAILLSPILFLVDLRWLRHWRGLAVVLHLGLVATALAYTLYARGLKVVATATSVTLSLAEPLTASLLGVFLLGERLALAAWIGVGLLFAGLAMLSLRLKEQKKP